MIDSLMSSASRLELVVLAGASLAGIILLLKILRQSEFEFAGVKINLGYAWLVFSIFTVAHIYTAVLFVRRCYQLFFSDPGVAKQGWEKLTGGELLWFDGLVARVKVVTLPSGFRLYEMDPTDPTTWLAHAAGFAIFFAVLRWRKAKWTVRIGTGIAALLLTTLNWGIGSNWVVAASELSLENRADSTYLAKWRDVLEAIR